MKVFLATVVLIAVGCNPSQATNKRSKGDTSAAREESDDGGPNASPSAKKKLKKSGNQSDEDSPDAQFYAEQFVLDGFETDDPEAFSNEPQMALTDAPEAKQADEAKEAVEAKEAKEAEESKAVPSEGGQSVAEQTTNDNEVEPVMVPAPDQNPTINDRKLSDQIAEFMMGLGDKDADGQMSEAEFLDARYFPKRALKDDVFQRIRERRAQIFSAFAGDDGLLSQAELVQTFERVEGDVKKLRVMRFLPYEEHLANVWKTSKSDFDGDGDGKLNHDELKNLRESRRAAKRERRSAVLAGTFELCQRTVDEGKDLPTWIGEVNERWQKKMAKKEKVAEKLAKKLLKKKKKKGSGKEEVDSGMEPGAGAQAGSETTTQPPEDQPTPTDPAAPTAGGEDLCAAILDRAASFGMAEDVVKILENRKPLPDSQTP